MAFDFPNSPTIGQIFGIYSWDGEKWAAASSATSGVTSFNTRAGAVTLTTGDVTTVLPGSALTPIMDGAAAIGVGTSWARNDHVHPTDTSRYAASNPAGYVTAASLGTMSTQNATAVAITGGAINNTSVGATTRSSGAFTTLAANGAATFTSSLTASPVNANVIISPTGSGVVTINPATTGNINNMVIGNSAAQAGTFTNLTASGTISGSGFAITGGSINSTPIGATTPSTGAFSTLTATTSVTFNTTGAVTINPTTVGSMNNVAIGSATQSSGSFTTLSASGNVAGAGFTTLLAPYALTSSLGTMATQNASAVAITGGAINGATVGATTAANGTFTNLVVSTSISATPSGSIIFTAGVPGSINNMSIGAVSPQAGSFTNLAASGTISGAGFTTLLTPYALVNSQVFTGTPSLPTGATGVTQTALNNSTKLATTAYADAAVAAQALGTMATQNASSVAITGGAINGTTVGAATASTGAFTTLSASGAATFTGSLTASPANANVTFSPTGTGTVTINPATAGAINNTSVGATTRSTGAFTTLTANAAATFTSTVTVSLAGAAITLNKPATGTGVNIFGQTNAVNRWQLSLGNATAESANAGSDFQLSRYNDAGTFLDAPLLITRLNGNAAFSAAVTSVGVYVQNAAAATDAIIYLNKPSAGQSCGLFSQKAGLPRWSMYLGENTAEGGSNAGSNFLLQNYTDAGAFISNMISAVRSSGIVTFANAIVNGSDAELKENVSSIPDALAKVLGLNGVSYNQIGSDRRDIGLIAQEVQAVVPEVVFDVPSPTDASKEVLGIAYSQLVGLLVNAIKELNTKVETLEARS